jgi:hypothetical protein
MTKPKSAAASQRSDSYGCNPDSSLRLAMWHVAARLRTLLCASVPRSSQRNSRHAPPSPSNVPFENDQDVFLLLDQLGERFGRVWRETDDEDTDFEAVVRHLLEGQFSNPVRVVAFNTAEGWSRDVSDEVADELRECCADRGETPTSVLEFLERHDTERPVQLPLPIAIRPTGKK